jgi:hypothetical protein
MLTFGKTVKYCSFVTFIGFLFGLAISDGSFLAAITLGSVSLMISYAAIVTTEVLALFVIAMLGIKITR